MFSEDLKKQICELEDCKVCSGYMQKDEVKDSEGAIVGHHLILSSTMQIESQTKMLRVSLTASWSECIRNSYVTGFSFTDIHPLCTQPICRCRNCMVAIAWHSPIFREVLQLHTSEECFSAPLLKLDGTPAEDRVSLTLLTE